jgi:hypothetical protein
MVVVLFFVVTTILGVSPHISTVMFICDITICPVPLAPRHHIDNNILPPSPDALSLPYPTTTNISPPFLSVSPTSQAVDVPQELELQFEVQVVRVSGVPSEADSRKDDVLHR